MILLKSNLHNKLRVAIAEAEKARNNQQWNEMLDGPINTISDGFLTL